MPRRDLALVAALGAILALPAVGYVAWLRRPPAARDRAVVVDARGPLEVRRAGASWQGSGTGATLSRGDEVRASGEGAVIDASGRFRLELDAGAVAVLIAPTEVSLVAGTATLEIPAGSTVTVTGRHDAAAEVSGAGGRFRATARTDALLVEALVGQVRVRGGGETVEVPAGRTATVPAGGAPAVLP